MDIFLGNQRVCVAAITSMIWRDRRRPARFVVGAMIVLGRNNGDRAREWVWCVWEKWANDHRSLSIGVIRRLSQSFAACSLPRLLAIAYYFSSFFFSSSSSFSFIDFFLFLFYFVTMCASCIRQIEYVYSGPDKRFRYCIIGRDNYNWVPRNIWMSYINVCVCCVREPLHWQPQACLAVLVNSRSWRLLTHMWRVLAMCVLCVYARARAHHDDNFCTPAAAAATAIYAYNFRGKN